MAESQAGEKSQQATPRRKQKAREQGNVPQSREISATVVFLSGLASLYVMKGFLIAQWGRFYASLCLLIPMAGRDGTLETCARQGLVFFAVVMGPLLAAVLLASVLSSTLQTGFIFTTHPLIPDLTRLDPLKGLEKLFSKQGAIDLVKNLTKTGLLAWMFYGAMMKSMKGCAQLSGVQAPELYMWTAKQAFAWGLRAALFMGFLAVLDYAWQRWSWSEQLMMTRQEFKQEMKESETNPHVKGRIRSLMKKWSGRRMMKRVPKATVVVTNPTHLAIAIQSEVPMKAPIVVAKGADKVAERIRALARENRIPLVENKPLARLLYRRVEVDGEIPSSMYQAVAEVLAYVYRLRRRGE